VLVVKISPRYDANPIVVLDGDPSAVGAPMLRQRRRFVSTLSSLPAAAWSAPSRCAEWTVQDVVAHLVVVDQFWSMSIASGRGGSPTRVLDGFDPKNGPAAMVAAGRGTAPADTLAAFVDASSAFCASVEALDDTGWLAIAESPAGHVTISALAYHALWDAWVHERDVMLPLGMTPEEEPDEIIASLRYAAALSPGFALQTDPARTGALGIVTTDPNARISVVVDGNVRVTDGDAPSGALTIEGDAVEILEALSVRAPLRPPVPAEHAWLVAELSTVFEARAGG
jgi:uncharacterized protein (TIGR03083 family)